MTWQPPRQGSTGPGGWQDIGPRPSSSPPPHVVLGEGIAFVIGQLEELRHDLSELRRELDNGGHRPEGS